VILSWPAGIAPGARSSELVSPVDLYATILDLAGAGVPAHCVGRSLRPLLEGGALAPRAALFGALYPLRPTEVRADAARDAYGLWARTQRWKYVLALKDVSARADAGADGEREDVKVSLAPDFVRKRGEAELYDLVADPHERANLAGRPEHAALEAELRNATLAWWTSSGGGPLDVP
jgi:N-sulfoglucosamine sulfohydrolase